MDNSASLRASTKVDDIFCTRDLEANIGSRSVTGMFVSVGSRICCIFVRLLSTIVLARLLTPDDFGLVAIALVITGFASQFKDAGLSMATVQKKNLTHEQASTLCWITFLVSAGLAFATSITAPVVSWVFDDSRLMPITIALATLFLISGLSLQQTAFLKRHMRIGALGGIDLSADVCALIASCSAAAAGLGYWALVVQLFALEIVRTLLVWVICPWKPGRPVRGCGISSMISFGANLTASNFVTYLTAKADLALIGGLWGAAPAGLYSKAVSLLQLPRSLVINPLGQVIIPALSRLQSDFSAYRSYYGKALLVSLSATMPIMAFAIIAAEPIVGIILGPQWSDAVPILRALGVVAFCQTLDGATGWVNISMGRADRRLQWRLISSPVMIVAVAIGVQWGAIGAAVGCSIGALLIRIPGIRFCLKDMPVSPHDVLRAAWRPLVSSVVAVAASVSLCQSAAASSTLQAFATLAAVFIVFYLSGLIAVSGGLRNFAKVYAMRRVWIVTRKLLPTPKPVGGAGLGTDTSTP